MTRILFVCTGNICRSPTAEAVVRHLARSDGNADHVEVDSAGTSGWHAGESPDPRSREVASRRGIDMTGIQARQVRSSDFGHFDLVLAMDQGHLRSLRRQCPKGARATVKLFLDYAPELGRHDVPDPYYGGADGFELVLDLIEAAGRRLLESLSVNPD